MLLRRSTPTFKLFLCAPESFQLARFLPSSGIRVDKSANFDSAARLLNLRHPLFSLLIRFSLPPLSHPSSVTVSAPNLPLKFAFLFEIFEKYGLIRSQNLRNNPRGPG